MKPSKEKKTWATFLVAVGLFLIAVNPLTGKYLNIISGIALTGVGYYLLKKK